MTCPTCKKKLAAHTEPQSNPFRPFCSDRCRLVDLGAWLDGTHRITEPLSDEDMEQAQPDDSTELDDRSGRN